jgi:hypothetical protein
LLDNVLSLGNNFSFINQCCHLIGNGFLRIDNFRVSPVLNNLLVIC